VRLRFKVPVVYSHWRPTIHPVQKARRWLFTRCAGCGERFPWTYGPVTGYWTAPPHRWYESEVGLYHSECYAQHVEARERVEVPG